MRKSLHMAAIAQLGERQTEALKVPGSIPGLGMLHAAQCCAWLSKAPVPCAMLRAVLAACPPSRWGRGARHRNARAAAKHRMHSLRKFLHMAAIAQLGECRLKI